MSDHSNSQTFVSTPGIIGFLVFPGEWGKQNGVSFRFCCGENSLSVQAICIEMHVFQAVSQITRIFDGSAFLRSCEKY